MQTEVRPDPPADSAPRHAAPRRRSTLLLRGAGWLLIGAGAVVLLYVVYALWFTDIATEREQASILDEWEAEVGDIDVDSPPGAPADGGEDGGGADGGDADTGGESPAEPDVRDAIAVLAFHRPGEDEPPVHADPLAVVPGVSYAELQRGPGHYPGSALPGEDGNFAVAGHRVTYGRPFHYLDEIEPGDEVHVWDRAGDHHVYEVRATEVVLPGESRVIGRDPLGTGEPTLTLTTCHPRFSARERLVMFAELVS